MDVVTKGIPEPRSGAEKDIVTWLVEKLDDCATPWDRAQPERHALLQAVTDNTNVFWQIGHPHDHSSFARMGTAGTAVGDASAFPVAKVPQITLPNG